MGPLPWARPYLLLVSLHCVLTLALTGLLNTKPKRQTGGINRHGMLGFDIFVGANRCPVINYLHYFITTIITSMGGPGTGFVMVGNFNY